MSSNPEEKNTEERKPPSFITPKVEFMIRESDDSAKLAIIFECVVPVESGGHFESVKNRPRVAFDASNNPTPSNCFVFETQQWRREKIAFLVHPRRRLGAERDFFERFVPQSMRLVIQARAIDVPDLENHFERFEAMYHEVQRRNFQTRCRRLGVPWRSR